MRKDVMGGGNLPKQSGTAVNHFKMGARVCQRRDRIDGKRFWDSKILGGSGPESFGGKYLDLNMGLGGRTGGYLLEKRVR